MIMPTIIGNINKIRAEKKRLICMRMIVSVDYVGFIYTVCCNSCYGLSIQFPNNFNGERRKE